MSRVATSTRQAVVDPAGQVRLVDLAPAPLKPGDVRIEVAYAGICGSDLHQIRDVDAYGPIPPERTAAFGHEYSGVVVEVGPGVVTVDVGDRVTCAPRWPCLLCRMCRSGSTTNCLDHRRPARGAWAREIVVPQQVVFVLADDVSLRTATLCEPLACALRGIDRAAAASGHDALVIGAGPIGLLTTALALRSGARTVLVSELNPIRRTLAEELGATAVDPGERDLADVVAERTGGLGPDVVYESVGRGDTVSQATELAAPGGTVVVLGLAPPRAVADVRPSRLFERELTVVAAWDLELTFQRAIGWLSELDLEPLATHVFALEDVERAIDVAASGDCGKVMLAPGGAPA